MKLSHLDKNDKTTIMQVYFQPWIGPDYNKSAKRILVLGDSHYCGACPDCGVRGNEPFTHHDCPEFTRNRIKEYPDYRNGKGEGSGWMKRTFLRFDKIFFGKEDVSPQESLSLWNSVAFYNFLQTAASSESSNGNYTAEDYRFSAPMTDTVFRKLKPDLVIAWGRKVWYSMSWNGWEKGDVAFSGTYTFEDGHLVHCRGILHPSRAKVESMHDFLAPVLS